MGATGYSGGGEAGKREQDQTNAASVLARENIVWGGRITRGQAKRAAKALEQAGEFALAGAFYALIEGADRTLGGEVSRMAADETVIWGS